MEALSCQEWIRSFVCDSHMRRKTGAAVIWILVGISGIALIGETIKRLRDCLWIN